MGLGQVTGWCVLGLMAALLVGFAVGFILGVFASLWVFDQSPLGRALRRE